MPVEKLEGAILRKLDTGFDIISREAIESLESGEAIALYTLMATRPNNWVFRKKWLMDRLGFGEERYKKARGQLIEKGYWHTASIREDGGTLSGRIIWFQPLPQKYLTEVPENRTSGKPELRENSMLKESENELKKQRKRFTPPSLQEVQEYIQENGYSVSAEAFVNYYESVGWMVGKNKMKSWHHAIGGWQAREKKKMPSYGMGGI